MSNETIQLPVVSVAALPARNAEFAAKAKTYAAEAQAKNTRLAYASDWATFSEWCVAQGVSALPATAATVTAWLIDTAGVVAVTTQRRRISAIIDMHRKANLPLDLSSAGYRDVWAGIRRRHGRPPAKKAALVTNALRDAIEALPENMAGVRDRALLLLGFAGALRRTELAAARISNDGDIWVEDGADGLTVHIGRSKGDQDGSGQRVGVPYGSHPTTCPVRAWRDWLRVSGLTEGPAFRSINRHGRMAADALSDHSVALIVKRSIVAGAIARGATEAEANERAKRFAGHSLRRGLATSAAANDAPGHLIQQQLRHKKYDTTAGYISEAQLHKRNAAGMAGL